jgi:hypothetical protein
MPKVRIATTKPDGTRGGGLEVDAVEVPRTDGLFVTHRPMVERADIGEEGDEGPQIVPDDNGWQLTHVPTGVGVGVFASRAEAEYVGRQLLAADRAAWSLADPAAVTAALPPWAKRWLSLVKQAVAADVPVQLLKGCAEFAREQEGS